MLLSAQLLAVMRDERRSVSETGRTIQVAPTVRPNRTVPEAEAPKTGVHFSANPTAHELLRTRVFEKEYFCKDGTHRWMRFAGRDHRRRQLAAADQYAKLSRAFLRR